MLISRETLRQSWKDTREQSAKFKHMRRHVSLATTLTLCRWSSNRELDPYEAKSSRNFILLLFRRFLLLVLPWILSSYVLVSLATRLCLSMFDSFQRSVAMLRTRESLRDPRVQSNVCEPSDISGSTRAETDACNGVESASCSPRFPKEDELRPRMRNQSAQTVNVSTEVSGINSRRPLFRPPNLAVPRSAVSSQELMEVVRSETVPPTVRAAFAQLVEHCHLDVAPLLPQPPVR